MYRAIVDGQGPEDALPRQDRDDVPRGAQRRGEEADQRQPHRRCQAEPQLLQNKVRLIAPHKVVLRLALVWLSWRVRVHASESQGAASARKPRRPKQVGRKAPVRLVRKVAEDHTACVPWRSRVRAHRDPGQDKLHSEHANIWRGPGDGINMKLGRVFHYILFYHIAQMHVRVHLWNGEGEPGELVEQWELRLETPLTTQKNEDRVIAEVLAARGYEHLSHADVIQHGVPPGRWPYVAAITLKEADGTPWAEFYFPAAISGTRH